MHSKMIDSRRTVSLSATIVALVLTLTLGASSAGAAFGVAAFDGQVTSDATGDASSQAGGHPYAISTEIELNHHVDPQFEAEGPFNLVPDDPAKDIVVDLPAGLIGNPLSAATCTAAQLANTANEEVPVSEWCPVGSQIGIITLSNAGFPMSVPLFNMQTPPTVPARFGFTLLGVSVLLDVRVRSDGDYGVSVDTEDISEALPIVGITLTIWGVPADPSHDQDRCLGWHFFLSEGPFCTGEPGNVIHGPNPAGRPPVPFMTQPTRCTEPGVGLETKLRADSWNNPGVFTEASFVSHAPPNFPLSPGERGAPVGLTGCDAVPFEPSISVAPTSSAPDSPTGLNVSLSIPTEGLENPAGIAQSELKKAVVTLPEGMSVNPSSADGLGACSPAEIALGSTGDPNCPDSSKIGTVTIDTPLLEAPLTGSVYLATQSANPFGSLLAVYLVAKGPGLIIKLPGRIDADPRSGRLTATFDNAPQLPFSKLTMSFKSGPRAPLVNPATCGEKTITSELTGWAGKSVSESSSFAVTCPDAAGTFAPGFTAGTSNPQAGGFSPFTLTLTRADDQQRLGGVNVRMPQGLLGVLKSVPQCPEAQASLGTCGAESLIGHTTVGVGAGSNPFFLGGQVFLTGPYKGAPFGLSIVVPAVAGPFDLGTVVVRAAIGVDPHTAQITVTSDSFPTILQGIPLDLRWVEVVVDRAGFIFNPTNCEPLAVAGTVSSTQGASVSLSSRFQAANCAALAFKPSFTVSTQGRTSKANGASLDVKVISGSGQANIGRVAVSLPKQLPSRLKTIQQACPEATFAANPGSCPTGSGVGTGVASTPVLAHALTGPAYLVSHGGAAFPELVVVLQGEGITVDLTGSIDIKGQLTSSTFAGVPDVPISSFELKLPEGPHSALAATLPTKAKGSLCGQSLTMPTTLTGQNGAQIKQQSKINVTGCAVKHKQRPKKHKAGKRKRPTAKRK